jgi:DNA-binding CsgD family transcriptional regulator
VCYGLLAAGMLDALSTRSDRPLVAATPVVALVAMVFTPRLRALEIILASVSLHLIVYATAVAQADADALDLSIIGVSAILGVVGAACRPRLARAVGDAAFAIAHRLQAHGVAVASSLAAAPPMTAQAEGAAGEDGVSRFTATKLFTGAFHPRLKTLSHRQKEVVAMVLQGLTAREIGTRLFISERTVETHLANVYERLDVHSRHQLIQSLEPVGLRLIGLSGAGVGATLDN